jgi:hypothetical protein
MTDTQKLAEVMSSWLIPTDAEVLVPFTLTIVDEWETEGGIGWSADVSTPSGASFSVENDGVGGANKYMFYDDASMAVLALFGDSARKAYPESEEAMDMACLWLEIRETIK